jgi:hypothetical protein
MREKQPEYVHVVLQESLHAIKIIAVFRERNSAERFILENCDYTHFIETWEIRRKEDE